jgi:hypothetical protein
MLTKRIKWIIIVCLFFCTLLLGTLGCAVATKMLTPQALKYPRDPRRSAIVIIEISRREEFFDQLRKFADKQRFMILIDPQPAGPEEFLISITGGDIEIDGANPFAPGEYHLGFYDIDHMHSAPEAVLDDLVNDFISFISEVQGTTFSIEK